MGGADIPQLPLPPDAARVSDEAVSATLAPAQGESRQAFRALWASRALLLFCVSISAGFCYNEYLYFLSEGSVSPDLTVFWTAARYALADGVNIYDPAQITALQQPLIENIPRVRPFPYPPTSLFLFGPFALLPYRAAVVVWLLVSCTLFIGAAQRLVPRRFVFLGFVTPPVVSCLLSLQVSLILGAGILFGVSILNRKPIAAGMVLGLVALVKPQVVLVFPVAALAMKSPRALAGFVSTGIAGVLLSLGFGESLWIDWLEALPEFQAIVRQLDLMRRSVTPNGIAFFLGLSGNAALLLQGAGILLGIVTCWLAFRHEDAVTRLIGLAGGSLLCTPYAMYHELSVLVPVLVMINASRRRYSLVTASTMAGVLGMFTLPLTAIASLADRHRGGFPEASEGRA